MVKEYLRPAYRAVTPGFSVQGSTEFLAFLKRAFDAREKDIKWNDDKSIGHGEIMIGDSLIELSEARPQWPARQCSVHLYVAGCRRAICQGSCRGRCGGDPASGCGLRRPDGECPRCCRQQLVHRDTSRGTCRARGLPLDHPIRHHQECRRGDGLGGGVIRRRVPRTLSHRRRQGHARGDTDRRLDRRVLRRQRRMAAVTMQPAPVCARCRRRLSPGSRWRSDFRLRTDESAVRRSRMRSCWITAATTGSSRRIREVESGGGVASFGEECESGCYVSGQLRGTLTT